jgi:hypothetical protein
MSVVAVVVVGGGGYGGGGAGRLGRRPPIHVGRKVMKVRLD